MDLSVDIDPSSGFCAGVIRAISRAENCLGSAQTLYSLGEIVHNGVEMNRLRKMGLKVVSLSELCSLESGDRVLIRAHGVPPEVYAALSGKGLEVEDCTCPVVLRLQKEIRTRYEDGSQVIIFGRVGHPEVLGLVGQTRGSAIVVENSARAATVHFEGPVDLFSQTTGDPSEYSAVAAALNCPHLTVHNSICAQVASRQDHLCEFARRKDVVIFVSGKASSNGKVLYELCKAKNPRTYGIESPSELLPGWFRDGDKVGICGATSTPKWLLEEVAASVKEIAACAH